MATNKRRALTAKSRVDSAIWHLTHLLEANKTQQPMGPENKKVRLGTHTKWVISQALYDLRNARTLLANTNYVDGDDSTKVLKEKFKEKLLKALED